MSEGGFRHISMRVPDIRSKDFKREAQRQARVVATSDHESDDQDFIEQISEDWPDTSQRKSGPAPLERPL